MTLLDFPGKVACTVFLSGCNFRCPFCHNSELLDPDTPGVMDDGLTQANCGDLEKHAYSVNDGGADGALRNLHILSGV